MHNTELHPLQMVQLKTRGSILATCGNARLHAVPIPSMLSSINKKLNFFSFRYHDIWVLCCARARDDFSTGSFFVDKNSYSLWTVPR